MPALTEDRWASLGRLAWYAARRWRGPYDILGASERHEAALTGIVAAVAAGVDDDHALIRAGQAAIQHEVHEAVKHERHAGYWVPGDADYLAEAVTDRVAVHQVTWMFTPGEWLAVYATAMAAGTGASSAEIAAAAGMTVSAYKDRLRAARARGRALWTAPGDTPPRRYAPGHTPVHDYRRERNRERRREAA